MKILVSALRLAAAFAVVAAVIATFTDAAGRGPINPFNFFGYFTVQSNSLIAIALAWAGVVGLSRRRAIPALHYFRAAATTYITFGGLAYALLLAPLGNDGGIAIPWANVVLHVLLPIYAPLDWLIFGDRPKIAMSRLWLVLIYPVIWAIVVLIRGATDGWVPYPFLDPSQGYGIVLLYVLAIFVVAVIIGALVFWVSRFRIIKVPLA